MIVDPIKHKKQPILPRMLSDSFKMYEDNNAVTITESAPNGVTTDAGIKEYAAKLNPSPAPTEKNKS